MHAPARTPGGWVVLPPLVLALLACCSCGDEEGGARPLRSAVLITLDTTRPDALGCFGAGEGVTPNLDRLAAEGVRYLAARTVSPETLPAHASILTGLYPPRHTVRLNSTMALPESAVTVAELARAKGMQTAAFVAAVVLDASFGLDQGFERYDQPQAPISRLTLHFDRRPAEDVVEAALGWFEGRDRSRPLFVWLHFYDPHAPCEPPEEFLRRGRGDPYLGEAARMDQAIGRFLDALRRDDVLDETLIIVVADHGEGRWEHGEETHGAFVFESTIRVPLLVRDPSGDQAGERSREIVSVVDVFPTLIEALDLGASGEIDGRSLYRRRIEPDRGVYFEACLGAAHLGWSPLAGWATAEGKYVHSSSPAYFEIARDPGETRDALEEHADEAKRGRAEIAKVLGRRPLASTSVTDETLMEKLRGLGYAGAGIETGDVPDPLAPSDRPSPNQRIEAYADFQRAMTLNYEGKWEEAIPLLEGILGENPENPSAHFQIGSALVGLERYEEAIAPLRRSLELQGSWRGPHIQLGLAYDHLGEVERAIEHYELAVRHDPGLEDILERLGGLLEGQGRAADAARIRILLRELRASKVPR